MLRVPPKPLAVSCQPSTFPQHQLPMADSFFVRRRQLLTGTLAVIAGCRGRPQPRDGQVRRIVSLTPNTTETVFAIGAGDRLVGRSRFCDFPPEVRALPAVGGYVDPSFEAILALEPDLVVGARGPAGATLVQRLEQRGIATWFPDTESIAGIEEMIHGLGQRTGRGAQADELVQQIRSRLAAIRAATASSPRPRVLLVFGLAPVVAAGPGSFPDEMLALAGADNAIRQGTRYPSLGMESVLGFAPDVVVDAAVAEGHGQDRIRSDTPGWRELEAVRKGRVIAIDDNSVLRPGPRVAEGVARLASALHPEIKL